ncbi:MAG: hypothetical protein IPK67_18275 [Planctomycetes bacterium]|nr:hypothetical protein [Planctomycetota bacterium]
MKRRRSPSPLVSAPPSAKLTRVPAPSQRSRSAWLPNDAKTRPRGAATDFVEQIE